jgi:two-component system phosphate regulon response regulator PhoB
MTKPHILIIEDDRALGDILRYNINQLGWEATLARDGKSGLEQARSLIPDLIILDLMLPVLDGLEVCRRLRSQTNTSSILILMLTARAEESDQVEGFGCGADDYVTKPFSVRLLLERAKALLRRGDGRSSSTDATSLHGITINRTKH